MTFCGMCVLGIWLRNAKYTCSDFIESIYSIFFKIILGILLCLYLKIILNDSIIIAENIYVIMLIFILPPAANIVALETAYLKSGSSINYIGASTIISIVYILLYYIFIHTFNY